MMIDGKIYPMALAITFFPAGSRGEQIENVNIFVQSVVKFVNFAR